MYMLLFQKLKDNREQVIKKRKKKEVNNVEEKNPKKNKVSKQGWELWKYNITGLWSSYCFITWVNNVNKVNVNVKKTSKKPYFIKWFNTIKPSN